MTCFNCPLMIIYYLRQLDRLERRIVILLSAFNILGIPLSVNEISDFLSENYKRVWRTLNNLVRKGIILKVNKKFDFKKIRGPKKAGRKPRYYAVYPLKDLIDLIPKNITIEDIPSTLLISKYVAKLYSKIQHALRCESKDCLFNLTINEIKEDISSVYRALIKVFTTLIKSKQYNMHSINIKIDMEKMIIEFKNKIILLIYHYEITELRPRPETIENLINFFYDFNKSLEFLNTPSSIVRPTSILEDRPS